MKRPSFQFYPADWQANSNLRRCTHAEKGVWIDVMCLLHDSEAYGVLRWPLKEIAQAVGCPVSLLKTLRARGVLKGAEPNETCAPLIYVPRSGRKNGNPVTLVACQAGPIWYSSRMVVDEYKRVHSGGSTRFSARQGEEARDNEEQEAVSTAPDAAASPYSSPCQRQGDAFGSSPSRRQGEDRGERQGEAPCRRRSDGATSSSSSSLTTPLPPSIPKGEAQPMGFARFWEAWPASPRKVGRAKCAEKWRRGKLDGQAEQIAGHVEAMKATRQWANGYEPAPLTYLNQRRWEDGLPPAESATLSDDEPWRGAL